MMENAVASVTEAFKLQHAQMQEAHQKEFQESRRAAEQLHAEEREYERGRREERGSRGRSLMPPTDRATDTLVTPPSSATRAQEGGARVCLVGRGVVRCWVDKVGA